MTTPPRLLPIAGVELSAARKTLLRRRIRFLVAGTIAYNVIEAAVAITAGTVASSTALVGFGLDSVVEVASAAAVAWQFTASDPHRREKVTLRLIAGSFFALAAYVTVESVRGLAGAAEADHSPVGIGLAALSLLVMPVLSYAQRRAGREFGSASAVADSKQTLLCTYLSAVLLAGLVANATWAGGGPIRLQRWSLLSWRSRKAGRLGAAMPAARLERPSRPIGIRPIQVAAAPTAAAPTAGRGLDRCSLARRAGASWVR